MDQKILVCYASGTGSTGEVAAVIGEELMGADVEVDVREAGEVKDLTEYSAVVVGSSIRIGRWLDSAINFLDRFGDDLSGRPVAYFMTCLVVIDPSEEAQQDALAYWEPILRRAPQVDPVGLGLFAGSLAPTMVQIPELQDSPYGDYRDWDTIRAWAREIRLDLLTGKPRSTEPMVLTGTILSYTDMSGYDLSLFDFRDSALVQSRLKEAKLRETNLERASLESADLRGADLSKAQLGWANLQEAQCREANFREANLMGANLKGADLQKANFTKAVMNGVILGKANLKQANLEGVDLNWANLQGCDLTGARLANADLGWANLGDVNLSDADLEGAHYNYQTKWPDGFSPEEAGCVMVKAGMP
jgi:menaquinone-dependent protoporphyrinogen oxidase